jgi:PAS domain S-box-containing protein
MPVSAHPDRLERAARHVEEGRRRVERQRQIISEREMRGYDATESRRTLEVFEETLRLFQNHLLHISTEQRQLALKESEARVQQSLAAARVIAFEWDVRTDISKLSDNAAQILGFDPLTGRQFASRIHPEDRAKFWDYVYNACPDDSPQSITFRFIRHDGQEVWLEETSKAEFDANGRHVGFKGLTRDITERKRAEEHQDLLVAELDHRVKNMLARVSMVALSTSQRSNSMQEFVKALDRRIRSMADAHDVLSRSRWQGANLADLIRIQLAPYTSYANTAIAGPDITLTAETTQALAMVLQELVTNALKYGALSNPGGNLSLKWNQLPSRDTAACIMIEWRETGGPRVVTPAQPGYGTSLIRELRRRNVDETIRPLLIETDHPVPQRLPIHPPILAASEREAPSSTAAIASSRRACAPSFARFATRRTSPAV